MSRSACRPTDLAILLVMALDGSENLCANEVRGKLKQLGFEPRTQQVAAWLGRMSREEMPCIERRDGWPELRYVVTQYGRTLLHNRFPHNRWRLLQCLTRAWVDPTARATDLRVAEPDKYPPSFDPEIVKAIHWCRLGRVRPDDPTAFHRAKQLGLLAQDSVWRATPQGEGVLIALGLLDGKPAPARTSQVVLWAVSERYSTPQLVRLWSEWQDECGALAAELDETKEDFESFGPGGPWRYFTTRAWLDIPPIPGPEDGDA